MKAYVLGYRPMTEEELKPDSGASWRGSGPMPASTLVAYSDKPEWVIPSGDEAEMECKTLNRLNVHVGTHLCNFSVEELPSGEFAVICADHAGRVRGTC